MFNIKRALRIGSRIIQGTVGSILFITTGGKIGQDNANFFWDDINKRLGVGTTTPDYDIDNSGETKSTYFIADRGSNFNSDFLIKRADNGLNVADITHSTGSNRIAIRVYNPDGTNPTNVLLAFQNVFQVRSILGIQTNNVFSVGLGSNQAPDDPQISFFGESSSRPGNTEIAYGFQGEGSDLPSEVIMKYVADSGAISFNFILTSNGNLGLGVTSPTAVLHLKAGTTTVAPLKFTSGALLTTPQDGTIEYLSNVFYLKNDDLNIDNLTASKPVWTDANKTLVSKDITPCDVVRNYITPTTQTVTSGTLSSGTVTDVQTWQDGNEVNITEVTGTPGFDILYTFENVNSFCEILVSFYYVGSATHDCVIEIYDDTNAVWKEFFSQSGAGLSHNTRFAPLPDVANVDNYINSSDQVKMRFYHPQSGNASHNLYIDYVSIVGDTL